MKRVMSVLCVVFAACTGSTGPTGPAGATGAAGTNGMDGSDGANGNNVVISDRAKHGLDISPVPIDTTGMTAAQIEAIGQGSYFVNAIGSCADCHGEAGTMPGFLAGGRPFGGAGTVWYTRNLTPDPTTGLQLTEAQFLDAIRTGNNYTCSAGTCTTDNSTLVVMPWNQYRWASTSDLEAVYAYLKAIPPVVNQVDADTGPHGPAAATFPTSYNDGAVVRPLPAEVDGNMNPIPDPDSFRRGLAIEALGTTLPKDATTEAAFGRGSYLVTVGACNDCHTNPARTGAAALDPINVASYLTGGAVFAFPAPAQPALGVVRSMSANLIGATNGFFGEPTTDFAVFAGILQTGLHVDEASPTPVAAPMPWFHLRNLTLDDVAALYTYLSFVWQDQPTALTADKATQPASYYCAATGDCQSGETCDTNNASATYHECIGRTCNVDADCPACQTCSGNGGTCGASLDASCVSNGI